MQPVRPIVEGLELYEQTLGGADNNQPEYIPLPALHSPDGRFLTRWRLSEEDKKCLIDGGDIFLTLSCGPGHYPPTKIVVAKDREIDAEDVKRDMLLDDEMELRMLAENYRRDTERLQESQAAWCKKNEAVTEKVSKL